VGQEATVVSTFINSTLTEAFLATHPRLQLITTRSTSIDHIDVAACRGRGVTVSHVPYYGETAVTEHTFALILALSRRLRELMALAHSKERFSYQATRGFDLCGKTLGVLGAGEIGQRVIALARAFQMRVIASDIETSPELEQALGFEFLPLEELLARSDILSLHLPLSPLTYHILDRAAFAKCKRGVIVVNTARGGLIDTAALCEALDSGQVGGAGLDVLEDERVLRDSAATIISADIVRHLQSDALAREARDADRVGEVRDLMLGDSVVARPNVVFTPHVAFNSVEAVLRRNYVTVENVRASLAGKPINVVA
nr:hydroxyacid dehydrogenase [Verrucomicrobiota bacterium]